MHADRLPLIALIALMLTACAPNDNTLLPTLAVLPTAIVAKNTATPAPTIAPRSTLPPTFTPTDTPTTIPITATASPAPTVTPRVEPTSALGSPLQAPENFPVNLTVRGGGFNLSAAPPPGVQYNYDTNTYHLKVAYNGDDGQTLALVLSVQETVSPGDYTLAPCADTDGTLPNGAEHCLSIVYTNMGIAAANINGGSLNLVSLSPLSASISADLTGTRLPNSQDTRYNPNAPIALTLEIAGQARTD